MPPPENYTPSPIQILDITLPPELDSVLEQLPEHVHDLWALRRMEDNWTWGAERSDAARTHPDLVPYLALDEHEKELDRTTARETLLAILALGYRIIPPEQPASRQGQKRE
jgi:hypothetical protein